MGMVYLLFGVGLSLSAVAAYYSIAGLIAIFAGNPVSIAVMGIALELSKLVSVSWLYRNWDTAPKFLRNYFIYAVFVLMLITTLGIFGFLSKSHVEQTVRITGSNEIQLEYIERKIDRQNKIIEDAEVVLSQLDSAVNTLTDFEKISGETGAIAIRRSQTEERNSLTETISAAYDEIETLQQQAAPLRTQKLELEAEVGPVKYLASFIYGDTSKETLEVAVTWVIVVLTLVFDPTAVLMLVAANYSLRKAQLEKTSVKTPRRRRRKKPIPPEFDIEPTVMDPIPMTVEELEKIKKSVDKRSENV